VRHSILLLFISVQFLQSQPPTPSPAIKSNKPQQPATNRQNQPPADKRGSYESPVVVKVLPPTKTKEETANDKARDLDQSAANWWMVRLTFIIAIISCVQTIVFFLQARRLKETIKKMDEIASGQARDIQASVAEATRAASAMEGVAASMATNTESVKKSVAISREIADTQKLVTELQSRAYLAILFEGMVPQDVSTGIRFEPRIRIENRGTTPAREIRFAMFADVQPFPLREDFAFPLPTQETGFSSVIGPGLHKIINAVVPKLYSETEANQIIDGVGQRIVSWGIVRYKDAFQIARIVRFGLTHYRIGETQWMSMDTIGHNEAD
jgi:hypothetical protein